MFKKKPVYKNFTILIGKHLCWNLFFNKSAGLQCCRFIKRGLQHRRFIANIEKFLKTPTLKKICERLLLRVPLGRFPTWAIKIGSEDDVFSKTKQNKKQQQQKKCSKTQLFKNLPFHDILHHFVFLYFSTARGAASALRGGGWWGGWGLGGLGQWAVNLRPMRKLGYLITYSVHLVLINWISELGTVVLSSIW